MTEKSNCKFCPNKNSESQLFISSSTNTSESSNDEISSCKTSKSTKKCSKCSTSNTSCTNLFENISISETYSDSCDTESSVNPELDLCVYKHPKKECSSTLVINERKLVNKMIRNYYNPKSISIQDNRSVLKKLIPIYMKLIKVTHNFIEKVIKLKHNLNPTKSSKIFRIIYDSYRSLVFNYYRGFSSILNIKYKGYDVLEYTLNNIESSHNNLINYAACNNFYETNNSMDKSTLFYSVPGFTLLFNNSTLSYRLIAKKSNFHSKCKIYKYDFLLIPGSNTTSNRVNKCSFLKVLDSISNFRNEKSNNILEFINFLHHEASNIKTLL